MRGFWPTFKRELLSLVVTPVAWVVAGAFLLIEGLYFFVVLLSYAAEQSVVVGMGPAQMFFGGSVFYYFPLVLVCPILTMRLFAEERRSGTIECLLTAPVDALGVVLGKYLATLVVFVAMWLPTLLYMMILASYGEVDWRMVGTGYLGTFLVGAAWLSIGTLASAMTPNATAAAVGAYHFILTLFLLGFAGDKVDNVTIRAAMQHISVASLLDELSRGLVDSRRLVFWVSTAVVPLVASVKTVEAWRWG